MINERFLLPENNYEEIIFRIKINQIPELTNLTELEYIYYSVGFFFFDSEKYKGINNLIETSFKEVYKIHESILYEFADLKFLLFDISMCTRGIGGVKTPVQLNDLPSRVKMNKLKQEEEEMKIQNETKEEKLKRHQEFFSNLKGMFINK